MLAAVIDKGTKLLWLLKLTLHAKQLKTAVANQEKYKIINTLIKDFNKLSYDHNLPYRPLNKLKPNWKNLKSLRNIMLNDLI